MSEDYDPILTKIKIEFPGLPDPNLLNNMTPVEVLLGESLLTPGLQTSVKIHSDIYHLISGTRTKNLDDFKNQRMVIDFERPILEKYGYPTTMKVDQTTVRLDTRHLVNNNIEEFTLRACDQSLLNDAENLVSKLWKCTSPTEVTRYVLRSCAGVQSQRLETEESGPARDYIAENIHPFQVVAQQAQAALAAGSDPSFVHYMTYENLGTHHFKSLFRLTKQEPIITLKFMETYGQEGYKDPENIMTHSFPCDFDLLSDILNGINARGENINTGFTVNMLRKQFNMFGAGLMRCGIGQGIPKIATSNEGSASQQNACPDQSKTYLLLRQARMALLEQDKIALRVTVPWNPIYHAGKIIEIDLRNKQDSTIQNYGSGYYLIVSMLHNIKRGGFSTTTMDCVAQTVGQGIV